MAKRNSPKRDTMTVALKNVHNSHCVEVVSLTYSDRLPNMVDSIMILLHRRQQCLAQDLIQLPVTLVSLEDIVSQNQM